MHFGGRWQYQQDNDSKHTSRVAKRFLDKKLPETIDLPSNSLAINYIENMWFILNRRTEKRKPSNIDELDQFVYEEWKKVDMIVISNLVSPMKLICLVIIDSKGERITY